jgi:Protein of unknown function (DUF2782)
MRAPLFPLLFLAASAFAADAQPPQLEPLPEIPPPPGMPSDEELEEAQVTIIQRGEERIEEYRMRGRLFMIKVTPRHGTPYFLIDPDGEGHFSRYEGIDPPLRVPMWVIFEW